MLCKLTKSVSGKTTNTGYIGIIYGAHTPTIRVERTKNVELGFGQNVSKSSARSVRSVTGARLIHVAALLLQLPGSQRTRSRPNIVQKKKNPYLPFYLPLFQHCCGQVLPGTFCNLEWHVVAPANQKLQG